MNERVLPSIRRRIGGQTLVIALIVLGVLLILGFVFLGLIDRSLHNQSASQSRSEANDLSEAGIRYAHSQLLSSELGADYRGVPTYLSSDPSPSTADPDLYYLRPGTGLPLRSTNDGVIDEGGPDGLGPFVRINFATGRALIRIRYAPSDANLFINSPAGALRNPGAARDYLIIESVGRTGQYIATDPTTASSRGSVQYANFANWSAFHSAYLQMQQNDSSIATSRRLMAMQAIGITEQAMFFTNKDHVNRAAEIGIPESLGVTCTSVVSGNPNTVTVGSNPSYPNPSTTYGGLGLVQQFGNPLTIPNASGQPISGLSSGGSIRSNADLRIYGNVAFDLNPALGEGIFVNGSIVSDNQAQMVVDRSLRDSSGNWSDPGPVVLGSGSFNSSQSGFSTMNGLIRDAFGSSDAFGFPRGVGREEPPSLLVVDQATGENRYVEATRDSGTSMNGVNIGSYGYGQGVYVDNFQDRQGATDVTGQMAVGSQASLVSDWLNPNNPQSQAWSGPFYKPPGAYVQLLSDGFVIQRDYVTWRKPDGTDSGSPVNRYRIGADSNGNMKVLSTWANYPLDMSGTLHPTDYDNGVPFNGVMYFEGNVRVRGYIATDVQIMLVSNATIYVEGNILKGDMQNDWTDGGNSSLLGSTITHAPQAMIMLAAKDYVAVNTPMFFGPTPNTVLAALADVPNDQQYKPVDLSPDASPNSSQALDFIFELALNNEQSPQSTGVNPFNPATYIPFATSYVDVNGVPITPALTLVHTMSNGPAASTFVSMLVNYSGNATSATYPFGLSSGDYSGGIFNAAYGINGNTTGPFAVWGLGGEAWQRYPLFEADEFPLNGTGTGAVSANGLTILNPSLDPNGFTLNARATNDLLIQPKSFTGIATNDYLLGRVTVTPSDVRIEASMFAEEGSFFVIPGQWTNPIPTDRHDLFFGLGSTIDEQVRTRLENFGSNPLFPFYGEPADVRITISGAISQNMPVPIAQQSEWLKKLSWIPMHRGSDTSSSIPIQHIPAAYRNSANAYVPNLTVSYDPVLATASSTGYSGISTTNAIRYDAYHRVLPPIPRLPVSPALAYFGEVN